MYFVGLCPLSVIFYFKASHWPLGQISHSHSHTLSPAPFTSSVLASSPIPDLFPAPAPALAPASLKKH